MIWSPVRIALFSSLRKILNFGHSISHAIEAALHYKISHGSALYWGIVIESYLSTKTKLLSKKDFDILFRFLNTKKLLVNISNLSISKVIKHINMDKKNIFGKKQFTLLKKIGGCVYNVQLDDNIILKSLEKATGGTIC